MTRCHNNVMNHFMIQGAILFKGDSVSTLVFMYKTQHEIIINRYIKRLTTQTAAAANST